MRSITVVKHATFKRGVSLCLKMQAVWPLSFASKPPFLESATWWLPAQMVESD